MGKKKALFFSNKGVIPLENIIAEYLFDDNLLDTRGNYNGTGVYYTYVDSILGLNKAVGFPAANSKIEMGQPILLNDSTVSALVKMDNLSVKSNLLQFGSHGYTNWGSLQIFDNTQVAFYYTPYQSTVFTNMFSQPVLEVDKWHHITLVRNHTDGYYAIFIDGIKSVTKIITEIRASDPVGNLKIGDGYSGDFEGIIDNYRLWDKALSDNEVGELAFKDLNGIDINP